jgi:hypothetical protein
MVDPKVHIISCDKAEEIITILNRISPELPLDIRRRLNQAKLGYLQKHGIQGLHKRVNNKTVATILAEYEGTKPGQPIETGEVSGVRYELYEAPDASEEGKGG